jgi:orotate phosphoribosyltransferase
VKAAWTSRARKQMRDEVTSFVAARKGHFRLESGHHGELWLDLELLCLRPRQIQRFTAELARRLSEHNVDAVCGPLVEGAFVGLMAAFELNVDFLYSERFALTGANGLYPVQYRIPGALRSKVQGKRVAIVNDVINAGSAVRATFDDLENCGARPVVVGSLLVLGSSASIFAAEKNVALETVAFLANTIWTPAECPLCASGVSLEDPGALSAQEIRVDPVPPG